MQTSTAPKPGIAIIAYLNSRGIRQTWIAKKLGMSKIKFNRFLHETNSQRLTPQLVNAIADALFKGHENDTTLAIRREWLALLNAPKSEAA